MKNTINKILVICTLIFLGILQLSGQGQKIEDVNVSGIVYDEYGAAAIGVAVTIRDNPSVGVLTDIDGKFKIRTQQGNRLIFSLMGFERQEYLVLKEEDNIKITLTLASHELSEAIITGLGSSQRRISIVGAITSVNTKDLQSPATSIPNMLAGRVAGVIARQNSGEPGENTSEFWVRGIGTFGGGSSALILIDGLEGNLNNIDPADIENFEVLKDASATAVYGVRGANGVILVTTKRGTMDRLHITARSSLTVSYLPRMPKYLGAVDYANLANEARVIRKEDPLYSDVELYIIKHNLDNDLYPDVNWTDEIIRRSSLQHTQYISARGGGTLANYFLSVSYSSEGSAYKQDKTSKYSSGVGFDKYTYRANIDMNMTKTTKVFFGAEGEFTKKTEPGMANTNELWYSQLKLTPVLMPTKYSTGQFPSFGLNRGEYSPYVMLNHTGLNEKEYHKNQATVALSQDLSPIVKGLTFRLQGALTNTGHQTERRFIQPSLWKASGRRSGGALVMTETRVARPAAYSNWQKQIRKYHLESNINYETIINKDHRFSALAYYYMTDEKITDEGETRSLQALPFKTQGISGRTTYGFKDTYFIDINFGYTGSANFKKGQRFGFFPAGAIGWIPTAYDFMQKGLPWLDFLKIRASYGLVGNDKIQGTGRFPYLTIINENTSTTWGYGEGGISEGSIGADNLKWEKAKKANIGIEGRLFKERVEFVIDIFRDQRDGIFQRRTRIPSYVGLTNMPFSNVGRMKSYGSDGTISFLHDFNKQTSLTVRGNFTYSTTKVQNFEQAYTEYPYRKLNGWPYNSIRGYIALGLFEDEEDIANSPTQNFSSNLMPGDIKYKDVNGDGKIDANDQVPLSYWNTPRLQYGIGLELRHKNVTVGARFTGTGKTDFYWTQNPSSFDSNSYSSRGMGYIPFQEEIYGNVLKIVNDPKNRWIPASYSGTKDTERPNARFPRLTYGPNNNNNQVSSYWKGDAKYLRLSEVSFNYNLRTAILSTIGVSSIDVSLVGSNLVVWDNVKLYDPDLARFVGQKYPIPARFTAQLYINF